MPHQPLLHELASRPALFQDVGNLLVEITVSVQNQMRDYHMGSSPLPQSSIPRGLLDVAMAGTFPTPSSRSWHTWLALT